MEQQHPLDRLVFDASNWVAAFMDILDALEVQLAIEDELAEETEALERTIYPEDEF